MRQIAVINTNGIIRAIPDIIREERNKILPPMNAVNVNPLNSPILSPAGIRIMSDTQTPGSNIQLNDSHYGNEYIGNDNIIGQLQPPTNFGKEITIVAEYWLAQKVRETTENRGIYIGEFEKEYYGSVKGQAWCAVFVWFIINEAAKVSNCTHNFPGNRQAWGSTVYTLNKSKAYYAVNHNPIAGSVMFRNSSGSYHHMGITLYVANNKIYTIEGNVKLRDGAEGIGLWEYDAQDISKYSMQFIHTENNSCQPKNIVAYHGYLPNISNPQILKLPEKGGNDNTGNNQSGNDNQTKGKTENKSSDDTENAWDKITEKIKNITEVLSNQDKFDSQTEEQKKNVCNSYINLMIPPKEAVPHYSVLKNPAIADDIFGTKISGKSDAEINGIAVNMRSSTENPGQRTGFGIFQDRAGNMIYLISSKSKKGMSLVRQGLIGVFADGYELNDNSSQAEVEISLLGSFNTFIFERILDSHDKPTESAKRLRRNDNKLLYDHSVKHYFTTNKIYDYRQYYHTNEISKTLGINVFNSGYSKPKALIKRGDYWEYSYFSIIEFLKDVEKKSLSAGDKKPTRPIVIYFKDVPVNSEWLYLLDDIMTMTQTVLAFAPVVGLNDGVTNIANKFLKAENTILKIAKGNASWNDFLALSKDIVNVIEFTSPTWAKGINNEYLKPMKDFAGELWNGSTISIKKYFDVDFSDGVPSWVNDLANWYGKNANIIQQSDIYKYFNDNFSENIKQLSNYLQMSLVQNLSKKVAGIAGNNLNYFDIKFKEVNQISDIPILQDFLINNASQTIMTVVPGMNKLAGTLISNPTARMDLKATGGDRENEIVFGLIKSAFGYAPDSSLFDSFVVQSLVKQADRTINDKFFLPPTIPKEKQICYRYEIQKNTLSNKEIIPTCDEGYKYDPKLRRCVSNQTTVHIDLNKKGGNKLPTIPTVPVTPTVPLTPTVPADKLPGVRLPQIPNTPTSPGTPLLPKLPNTPTSPGIPVIPKLPNTPTGPGTPTTPKLPNTPTSPGTPTTPDLKPCEDTLKQKINIINKYIQDLRLASDKVKSCEQLNNQDRQKIIEYENQINYLKEQLKQKPNNTCESYIIELQNLRNKVQEYEILLRNKSDGINKTGQDSYKDAQIEQLKKQLKDYQDKFNEYDKSLEKHDKEELITPCIHKLAGKYFYLYEGAYLPAKQKAGNWLALYHNYYVLIKDCQLQIISKPPTTPLTPIPPAPAVPKTPLVPVVPDNPNQPANCPGCPKLEITKRIYEYPKCDEDSCSEYY